MIRLWESWVRRNPIILLEDGMGENDWDGWRNLIWTLGSKIELVGDHIFYTNKKILAEGIKKAIAERTIHLAERSAQSSPNLPRSLRHHAG